MRMCVFLCNALIKIWSRLHFLLYIKCICKHPWLNINCFLKRLKTLFIDCIAFQNKLFKNIICPFSESYTSFRINSISDRQNHIQIINFGFSSPCTSVGKTDRSLIQFSWSKNIWNMFAYCSVLNIKQHFQFAHPIIFFILSQHLIIPPSIFQTRYSWQ